MKPGRVWRRTKFERGNGEIRWRSDDWTLYVEASGLEIARIYRENEDPTGNTGMPWRCIVRQIIGGELKDEEMCWQKTGKEAKEYCEKSTDWRSYSVGRKRTKEEILAHAGVRPNNTTKKL